MFSSIFGPTRSEIWHQLECQIGGRIVERGFWNGGEALVARVQNWTVTLDEYAQTMLVNTTPVVITHTRMRAPFGNPSRFRFVIHRTGLLDELGKLFGMQDVEVGEPEFDRSFILQSNDPSKVRMLFGSAELRALVQRQANIHLSIVDDEGWFGERYHPDVNVLVFDVAESIDDTARLKGLFDIFAETLDSLSRMNVGTRIYR